MTLTTQLGAKLELSSKEFILIGRALRRALRPEEYEDAEHLQNAMAEQRLVQFDHLANEMNKLRENLKAGNDTQIPKVSNSVASPR